MNGWIYEFKRRWIHDKEMDGGLENLFTWMVSLDIYFLSFLFSRNFYYFLIDVGRIVNGEQCIMKKVGLRGWSGWEEDMVDGC